MTKLRVKNWARFQHYGKPGPVPWIKLHTVLLNDHDFSLLSEAKRYQLVAIWLLAASSNGVLPHDSAFIARRTGTKRVDLDAFVAAGWLEVVEGEPNEVLPF